METTMGVIRSSFPMTPTSGTGKRWAQCFSRRKGNNSKLWKSPALQPFVLILAIIMCWTLIAILQYLLVRSEKNGGIIFAPKISALPVSRTFLYMYFPTIVAVLFSIFWAWIDLETKRLEPYYHLSKENGALGKDSLLLSYPFSFLPLVPLKAFKDKHWPVFCASLAVVLITWGLVPVQAGIFTTETITRTHKTFFERSTNFIPAEKQGNTITLRFAQSTYGIATLNETLPPFMARNYTLAPFRPSVGNDTKGDGSWTAPTTQYSMDLACEPAIQGFQLSSMISNSSTGCSFRNGLTGNVTTGSSDARDNKEFLAMYVGYWNPSGNADYYLDGDCPPEKNNTFYAAFAKKKPNEIDPPNPVTAIFCETRYWQQSVNATIDKNTRLPTKVIPLAERETISPSIFNATWFESLANTGGLGLEVRGDILPVKSMPSYVDFIAKTNLSTGSGAYGGSYVHSMASLAFATSDQPIEDNLDWNLLSKSYSNAYGLMFARAMVEVLREDFSTFEETSGLRQINTETLSLEPVFTYIVEGLLAVVSVAAAALLYISRLRDRNLLANPSTIASVMSLVADNQLLLTEFEALDCCTMEQIETLLGGKRFKLFLDSGAQSCIIEIPEAMDTEIATSVLLHQPQSTITDIAKPVRPIEFSLYIAFPVIGLFLGLAIALAIVFVKARSNGLPLPSNNRIVQNILENYIPTALATLIEPMWILINRLLCMLQPIEELQRCNTAAKKSIDLDYSSLPPQLTLFKAIRSRHFVLAIVCAMALLANVLAVALSGLFNQDRTDRLRPVTFTAPFQLKFVPINGSIGPISGSEFGSFDVSGAYQGGNGQDQFFVAESNYTQGTPLPAWTDDKMFYLPIFTEGTATEHASFAVAETRSFGMEPDCASLMIGNDLKAALMMDSSRTGVTDNMFPSINLTVTRGPKNIQCTIPKTVALKKAPIGSTKKCVEGPSAAELMYSLQARPNATQEEVEVCMGSVILGWIRQPDGTCRKNETIELNEQNSIFVQCQPKWITGRGKVRVDAGGRLLEKVEHVSLDREIENNLLFSNDPVNLVGQSNRYIFKYDSPVWHNDKFANDALNYFIRRGSNSSRLVDPTHLPTFEEIQEPLEKAYSRLFAIWLGINKDKLLVPSPSEKRNQSDIQGWRALEERRIFLSTPMFYIAETILCTYAIVTIMVYMRRPGQYLARLPTSIASVIALFAASAAVQDMRGTSHLDKKERARYFEDLGCRYGYGSYIGGDTGRVHIGIEKIPFVRARATTTWLERKVTTFRNGAGE